MAAIWRRAWRSKKTSSSTGHVYGGALHPISSNSTTTTSGTRTTLTQSTSRYITSSETVRQQGSGGEQESAVELRQELVETRRHMRGLVDEFRAGADGNATAPDRWLSELRVAWLLRLAELDVSGQRILVSQEMQSWLLALKAISTSIWKCLSGFYGDDDPPAVAASEFTQFVKATLLKMLAFADAIAALDPLNAGGDSGSQQHVFSSSSVVGAADKIRALLDVHHALSTVSEQIMMAFCSSPHVQSTRVTDDIGGFLSAELGKVDQAIRDTVDHISTAVILSLDDHNNDGSSSWNTSSMPSLQLQSSPDIHKVTRSVMNYINNVLSAEALLRANYARDHVHTCSLTTLAVEVVGYLEEELAIVSVSFTDQSLRFIFLINNSHFIQQQLDTNWPAHLLDLTYVTFFNSITNRIDRYIQNYLQVTWAPVLKCLSNPTCSCFMRDSALPKFESKFQSTYAAQKHWKVPDPELRNRLRQAITERVVSGFREYLEDNNRITSGVLRSWRRCCRRYLKDEPNKDNNRIPQ